MSKKPDKKNLKALFKLQSLLSNRDHSEYELKVKLLKHFSEQEITDAVKQAYKNKWLKTPEELTHQLTEELHRKKKGWLYIQNALKRKQLDIPPFDEKTEEQKCLWQIEKKFNALKKNSQAINQKMIRYLTAKGFTRAVIYKTIKKYFSR